MQINQPMNSFVWKVRKDFLTGFLSNPFAFAVASNRFEISRQIPNTLFKTALPEKYFNFIVNDSFVKYLCQWKDIQTVIKYFVDDITF